MTEPTASLGRESSLMAVGTLASRVLGLVRGAVLVAAVGSIGPVANAFDVANRLPNALLAFLAAGVGAGVLIPRFVKAFAEPGGKSFVDRVVTILLFGALVATVIATVTAPVWVWIYSSSNADPEQTALAVAFAYWCLPQLFFYFAYLVLGQVLNARGKFASYMWAPVVNNVISIVGLLAYLWIFGRGVPDVADWTPERIAVVGGVATLGVIAQAVTLIIPVYRSGYRWKWRLRGQRGELTSLSMLVTWVVGAVLLDQIPIWLTTRTLVGVSAIDGVAVAGNAAYTNALTLALLPHSLLTLSIVTAYFPTLAKVIHEKNSARAAALTTRTLSTVGLLSMPAATAVVVAAPFAVHVAFPTLEQAAIDVISPVLQVLAIGLVPLGATLVFRRVQVAYDDGRGVFMQHIPVMIVWSLIVIVSAAVLDQQWWAVGAAAGQSLSYVMSTGLRAWGVRRLIGAISYRRTIQVHGMSLVASLAARGAAWLATRTVAPWAVIDPDAGGVDWASVGGSLAVVGVAGVVIAVVYAALMWWWKPSEWTAMTSFVWSAVRRVLR